MTTDSGGWTIIDYSLHADWSNQFNGWTSWNTTAGPNQYASPYSWESWFALDNGNTEYRVSEDCQIATSATSNQVYKMTGDHYGCVWYNTNCPMVGDQCFECTNPYGTVNLGSCSILCRHPITITTQQKVPVGPVETTGGTMLRLLERMVLTASLTDSSPSLWFVFVAFPIINFC